MHRYRSHTCGALRASDIGNDVRLSGWCHRVRDHGGVLFIDLRDHYGITQVVADPDSPAFKVAETLRAEWVVRIDGKVRRRPEGTDNPDLPTGPQEVIPILCAAALIRCTLDIEAQVYAPDLRMLRPAASELRTASATFCLTAGRPKRLPFALARAIPACTRSTIHALLELCKDAEHLKHRLARGRRRIEPLLVKEKTDSLFMEALKYAEEIRE